MSEYNLYKRDPKRTKLSSVVEEQEGRKLQCCLVPETPEKPLPGRPETKKLATQEMHSDLLSGSDFAMFSENNTLDCDKPTASCVTMISLAEKNTVFSSCLALTDEYKEQNSDRTETISLGSGDRIDLNISLDSRGMIDLNVGQEDEQSCYAGLIDLNSSKENSLDGTRGHCLESACSSYEGLRDLNESIHSLENVDCPNGKVMKNHKSESTGLVSDAGVNIFASGEMNNGFHDWNSILSLGYSSFAELPKPEASQLSSQILTQETDTEKLSSNQNGGNGTIDSKKSQKRVRKKKHRPKVLMDGKRTIQKPATPKQVREKKPRGKSKSSGLQKELFDKINAETKAQPNETIAPVARALDFRSESLDVVPKALSFPLTSPDIIHIDTKAQMNETKASVARALDFQSKSSESLDVVLSALGFPLKSLDIIHKKRRSNKRRRKLNLFKLYVTKNDKKSKKKREILTANWGRKKRRMNRKKKLFPVIPVNHNWCGWQRARRRTQKKSKVVMEKDTKAIETNVSVHDVVSFSDTQANAPIENAALFVANHENASIENAALFVANHELEGHENASIENAAFFVANHEFGVHKNASIENAALFVASIENAALFVANHEEVHENAALFVANHELEVHENALVINNEEASKGIEVLDSAMKGKRKHKANAITKPKGKELALHVNDNGALVPYQGPFDPTKRKKTAKVKLDPETLRVWNLLMNTDDDKSEEKESEENEKWWEQEREVFAKRVLSFIARMDKIQGDRSFRKWNGSVLDSVVGVFLTQNAADYLSSNAFMSLVSKFPSQPCQNGSCDEVLGTRSSQESAMEAVQTEYFLEGNQYFVREPTPERNEEMGRATEDLIDGVEETGSTQNEDIASVCKPNTNLPEVEAEMGKASDASHGCQEERMNFQSQNLPVGAAQFPVDNVVQSQNGKMQDGNATIRDQKSKPSSRGKKKILKEEKGDDYWESLRLKYSTGKRGSDQMDAVDWEAVRLADVNEVATAIEVRGQHTVIAAKIQDFLNRLVRIHKCLDLEWLRNIPPDKAKEYLLAVNGLGLKSVECVRLLSLRQVAFPVDTNVARIAVRLGWVPLKPLPEQLQLHLIEQYPILDSIQIFLWPRLCTLPKETLYKLHTQMIGFGKIFCSKKNPNCNACPMRAECRHFASAYASAMNALPGPASSTVPEGPIATVNPLASVSSSNEIPLLESGDLTKTCEPIIEEVFEPFDKTKASSTVPESPTAIVSPLASVSSSEEIPPPESGHQTEFCLPEIEDLFEPPEKSEASGDEESEIEFDSQGIPIIKISISNLKATLLSQMKDSSMFEDGYNSRALVALNSEAVSIPAPKLKNVSRLRTEHLVYELPRNHPLLEGLEPTKSDEDVQYHLAIWSSGETADSSEPSEKKCNSTESENCNDLTCYSCNSIREQNANIVRGTLLIPCRVANRHSFPLNGTYFQDNEVFADHETSLRPFIIRRDLIYNLPRRIAYFGSSISAIARALSTRQIQQLFWKGIICVRGFERSTRAPRPLVLRFHCKQTDKKKEKQEQKSGKRPKKVKEKTQETDGFTR